MSLSFLEKLKLLKYAAVSEGPLPNALGSDVKKRRRSGSNSSVIAPPAAPAAAFGQGGGLPSLPTQAPSPSAIRTSKPQGYTTSGPYRDQTPAQGFGTTPSSPSGTVPKTTSPSPATYSVSGRAPSPTKVSDDDFDKIKSHFAGLVQKNPELFSGLKGHHRAAAEKYFTSAAAARQAYGVPIGLSLGIGMHESRPGLDSRLARETGNLWGVKHRGGKAWSTGASKLDVALGEMKPGSTVSYQVPPSRDAFNWYANWISKSPRYGKHIAAGGDLGQIATNIQRSGYTSHGQWGPGVARLGAPYKTLDDFVEKNPYKL